VILWRLIIEGLGPTGWPHMSNHLDDARLDELLVQFGSSSEIAPIDPNAFGRVGNLIGKTSSYRPAVDAFPLPALPTPRWREAS
jgi:hypothetical protein